MSMLIVVRKRFMSHPMRRHTVGLLRHIFEAGLLQKLDARRNELKHLTDMEASNYESQLSAQHAVTVDDVKNIFFDSSYLLGAIFVLHLVICAAYIIPRLKFTR